jgi:hypothetical protein
VARPVTWLESAPRRVEVEGGAVVLAINAVSLVTWLGTAPRRVVEVEGGAAVVDVEAEEDAAVDADLIIVLSLKMIVLMSTMVVEVDGEELVVGVDGEGLVVKVGVVIAPMTKAIQKKLVGESQLVVKLGGEIVQMKKAIQKKVVGESQHPAMVDLEMLDGVLLLGRMILPLAVRVGGERLAVKVGVEIVQTKKAIQQVVGEPQLPAMVNLEIKILDGVLLMRRMQLPLVVRVDGEGVVVGVDGEGLEGVVVKVGVEVVRMKTVM